MSGADRGVMNLILLGPPREQGRGHRRSGRSRGEEPPGRDEGWAGQSVVMIVLKSEREIEIMRRAGRIVARILQRLREEMKPGITTLELDGLAERLTRKAGALPAFKGYRGYQYALCASVNEQVVHGVPTKRPLCEGDIVGLDFGVIIDGFYGDAAITVPVGKVAEETKKLLDATVEALARGIAKATPAYRLHDIGAAIQAYTESRGYSVVREYVGHGIGRELHEPPQIPNYGDPDTGVRLRPGMVLAIEPMINAGAKEVETLEDGWTVVTKDRSLSAHFEHTVAIMGKGTEVLTAVG
jgi:methionyl aminopeptidase